MSSHTHTAQAADAADAGFPDGAEPPPSAGLGAEDNALVLDEGDVAPAAAFSQSRHHLAGVHSILSRASLVVVCLNALLFWRDANRGLLEHVDAIVALVATRSLLVLACLLVWLLPLNRRAVRRRYYVVMTTLACVQLTCVHAISAAAATCSRGTVPFLTPVGVLVAISYTALTVNWLGLRPGKICALASVAFVPLIVISPILAVVAEGTAEFSRAREQPWLFWSEYIVSSLAMVYVTVANILNGWVASAEAREERNTRRQLMAQATKAQALLETAVPPVIARELMSGTPAHALTRSFPSVSIAFIALPDFEDMVAKLQPHELLQWLDDIYGTWDRLIDLYDESINKIETVGGCYLVSCGLPIEVDDHPMVLAQFCADVLDLCQNIAGARVNVKIGINCGPVTAGVIGRSRQFYRVFGDTINVASRMMSTGELNRIHCTSAVAQALEFAGVEQHGLRIEARGMTAVKGKGRLLTFWVSRASADALPEDAAFERDLRLRVLMLENAEAADISGAAAMNMLVSNAAPTERRVGRLQASGPGSHGGASRAAGSQEPASPESHFSQQQWEEPVSGGSSRSARPGGRSNRGRRRSSTPSSAAAAAVAAAGNQPLSSDRSRNRSSSRQHVGAGQSSGGLQSGHRASIAGRVGGAPSRSRSSRHRRHSGTGAVTNGHATTTESAMTVERTRPSGRRRSEVATSFSSARVALDHGMGRSRRLSAPLMLPAAYMVGSAAADARMHAALYGTQHATSAGIPSTHVLPGRAAAFAQSSPSGARPARPSRSHSGHLLQGDSVEGSLDAFARGSEAHTDAMHTSARLSPSPHASPNHASDKGPSEHFASARTDASASARHSGRSYTPATTATSGLGSLVGRFRRSMAGVVDSAAKVLHGINPSVTPTLPADGAASQPTAAVASSVDVFSLYALRVKADGAVVDPPPASPEAVGTSALGVEVPSASQEALGFGSVDTARSRKPRPTPIATEQGAVTHTAVAAQRPTPAPLPGDAGLPPRAKRTGALPTPTVPQPPWPQLPHTSISASATTTSPGSHVTPSAAGPPSNTSTAGKSPRSRVFWFGGLRGGQPITPTGADTTHGPSTPTDAAATDPTSRIHGQTLQRQPSLRELRQRLREVHQTRRNRMHAQQAMSPSNAALRVGELPTIASVSEMLSTARSGALGEQATSRLYRHNDGPRTVRQQFLRQHSADLTLAPGGDASPHIAEASTSAQTSLAAPFHPQDAHGDAASCAPSLPDGSNALTVATGNMPNHLSGVLASSTFTASGSEATPVPLTARLGGFMRSVLGVPRKTSMDGAASNDSVPPPENDAHQRQARSAAVPPSPLRRALHPPQNPTPMPALSASDASCTPVSSPTRSIVFGRAPIRSEPGGGHTRPSRTSSLTDKYHGDSFAHSSLLSPGSRTHIATERGLYETALAGERSQRSASVAGTGTSSARGMRDRASPMPHTVVTISPHASAMPAAAADGAVSARQMMRLPSFLQRVADAIGTGPGATDDVGSDSDSSIISVEPFVARTHRSARPARTDTFVAESYLSRIARKPHVATVAGGEIGSMVAAKAERDHKALKAAMEKLKRTTDVTATVAATGRSTERNDAGTGRSADSGKPVRSPAGAHMTKVRNDPSHLPAQPGGSSSAVRGGASSRLQSSPAAQSRQLLRTTTKTPTGRGVDGEFSSLQHHFTGSTLAPVPENRLRSSQSADVSESSVTPMNPDSKARSYQQSPRPAPLSSVPESDLAAERENTAAANEEPRVVLPANPIGVGVTGATTASDIGTRAGDVEVVTPHESPSAAPTQGLGGDALSSVSPASPRTFPRATFPVTPPSEDVFALSTSLAGNSHADGGLELVHPPAAVPAAGVTPPRRRHPLHVDSIASPNTSGGVDRLLRSSASPAPPVPRLDLASTRAASRTHRQRRSMPGPLDFATDASGSPDTGAFAISGVTATPDRGHPFSVPTGRADLDGSASDPTAPLAAASLRPSGPPSGMDHGRSRLPQPTVDANSAADSHLPGPTGDGRLATPPGASHADGKQKRRPVLKVHVLQQRDDSGSSGEPKPASAGASDGARESGFRAQSLPIAAPKSTSSPPRAFLVVARRTSSPSTTKDEGADKLQQRPARGLPPVVLPSQVSVTHAEHTSGAGAMPAPNDAALERLDQEPAQKRAQEGMLAKLLRPFQGRGSVVSSSPPPPEARFSAAAAAGAATPGRRLARKSGAGTAMTWGARAMTQSNAMVRGKRFAFQSTDDEDGDGGDGRVTPKAATTISRADASSSAHVFAAVPGASALSPQQIASIMSSVPNIASFSPLQKAALVRQVASGTLSPGALGNERAPIMTASDESGHASTGSGAGMASPMLLSPSRRASSPNLSAADAALMQQAASRAQTSAAGKASALSPNDMRQTLTDAAQPRRQAFRFDPGRAQGRSRSSTRGMAVRSLAPGVMPDRGRPADSVATRGESVAAARQTGVASEFDRPSTAGAGLASGMLGRRNSDPHQQWSELARATSAGLIADEPVSSAHQSTASHSVSPEPSRRYRNAPKTSTAATAKSKAERGFGIFGFDLSAPFAPKNASSAGNDRKDMLSWTQQADDEVAALTGTAVPRYASGEPSSAVGSPIMLHNPTSPERPATRSPAAPDRPSATTNGPPTADSVAATAFPTQGSVNAGKPDLLVSPHLAAASRKSSEQVGDQSPPPSAAADLASRGRPPRLRSQPSRIPRTSAFDYLAENDSAGLMRIPSAWKREMSISGETTTVTEDERRVPFKRTHTNVAGGLRDWCRMRCCGVRQHPNRYAGAVTNDGESAITTNSTSIGGSSESPRLIWLPAWLRGWLTDPSGKQGTAVRRGTVRPGSTPMKSDASTPAAIGDEGQGDGADAVSSAHGGYHTSVTIAVEELPSASAVPLGDGSGNAVDQATQVVPDDAPALPGPKTHTETDECLGALQNTVPTDTGLATARVDATDLGEDVSCGRRMLLELTDNLAMLNLRFPDLQLERNMRELLLAHSAAAAFYNVGILGIVLGLGAAPFFMWSAQSPDADAARSVIQLAGVLCGISAGAVLVAALVNRLASTVRFRWVAPYIIGSIIIVGIGVAVACAVLHPSVVAAMTRHQSGNVHMTELFLLDHLPIFLVAHLIMYLRIPFHVAAGVCTVHLIVSISSIHASVAGTPADRVFGTALLVTTCIGSCIACYLREIGDRSHFTAHTAAKAAEADANTVLRNLLPSQVVQPIMDGKEVLSQVHTGCAIMFADLAGFTRMASSMDPNRLMVVLNTIYSRFDDMVEKRKLWKAETIGDAYVVVGGLFSEDDKERAGGDDSDDEPERKASAGGEQPDDDGGRTHSEHSRADSSQGSSAADGRGSKARRSRGAHDIWSDPRLLARARAHLENMFDLGLAMQRELQRFRGEVNLPIHMRIGIHLGDVVTGIVGSHRPRFGVFGVPVLIAEQLEALATPDTIMCSVTAQRAYLASSYGFMAARLPEEAAAHLREMGDEESFVPVDAAGGPLLQGMTAGPLSTLPPVPDAPLEAAKVPSAAAFAFHVSALPRKRRTQHGRHSSVVLTAHDNAAEVSTAVGGSEATA